MLGSTPGRGAIYLFEGWQAEGKVIVAPLLLRYEVTNALWQMRKHGRLSRITLEAALQALVDLPISIRDSPRHYSAAMEFAERFNLPATYDAHYLALAEELDCEFWTADKRLARATNGAFPLLRLVDA